MNPISALKDVLELIRLLNDTPPIVAFGIGVAFGGALIMMFSRFLKRNVKQEKPGEETPANKPTVVVDRNPAFFYEGYLLLFLAVRSVMELAGKATKDNMRFLLYRGSEEVAPFVVVPEKYLPEKLNPAEVGIVVQIIKDYYQFVLGPRGFEIAYDHGYKRVVEVFFDSVRWLNS